MQPHDNTQYSAKLIQRFWEKVDKHGPIHLVLGTECWLWTAYTNPAGYGDFQLGEKRGTRLAHRLSWELHNGPILFGLHCLHHCDTPPCIRPDHLFLGTHTDNIRDMYAKGRARNGNPKEHTPRGELHPGSKLTENQVREIIELRNQGLSYAKIAVHYDLLPQSIGEICRGELWTHIDRPVVTFTDAVRKLTEPQVIEILARLKQGESQTALAREFGVHPATVQSIVAFKSWRHIPRP